MFLFIVWAVISFAGLTTQDGPWTYDEQHEWPGLCRDGGRQSPININTAEAVLDTQGIHIRGPLSLTGYRYAELTGMNNGHTVQFHKKVGMEPPQISGGPLLGSYNFIQLHFHWLGEHAINYIKYPMEIHFVHQRSDMTLNEAVSAPDGLVVIAVMCQVQARSVSDRALNEVIDFIPQLISAGDDVLVGLVDLTTLLSDTEAYYTYVGSLTTPNCEESVTWIVLEKPLVITDDQYKVFSKVDVGGSTNFRSLQPLNGRTVFRSAASAAVSNVPSVVTGLVSALFGLTTGVASILLTTVAQAINATNKIKKKVFNHLKDKNYILKVQ